MNNTTTEAKLVTEVALQLYAAVQRGDVTAALDALHPEVELHVPGTHPLAGAHRGPDAVLGFVAAARERTDDGEHIEVIDVLASDRHVAVLCEVRATRAGRRPLHNRTVHLLRVADDRIAEIWLHNFDDLSVNDFWS